MSVEDLAILALSEFECLEEHVYWEKLEPAHQPLPKRLMGSGKTLFEFHTNHGVLYIDERHIMSWDVDEDEQLLFQALAQRDNEWFVLDTCSGHLVDQHQTLYYDIKSIVVSDCRGCHRSFTNLIEVEQFLQRQANTIKALASEHGLDVSNFYLCDDVDDTNDVDDSDDSQDSDDVPHTPAQTQETVHDIEEVELKHMTDAEIAVMMNKEIQEQKALFILPAPLQDQTDKLNDHVQKEEFEQAIELAAIIRYMFRHCDYHEGVEELIQSLKRPIVGDDLSHVRTFEEMESLKRTHNYIRVHIVPIALLGNDEELASSRQNVLYVTKTVKERLDHVHELLEQLVDQGTAMSKGRQIQLELVMRRILKSSFVPNELTYKIRGFQNLDMVVNVW